MEISYYRKLKNIDRLQSVPKQRNYNLLEHQYMVGMLFRHFASKEDIAYDIKVWDLVLNHDILESVTIDLPWNIKNFSSKTKEAWGIIEEELISKHFQLQRYSDKALKSGMTPIQFALFKVCDTLDLLIFVKEEQALGNNTDEINEVEENCYKIMDSLEFKFPKIKQFIQENYG